MGLCYLHEAKIRVTVSLIPLENKHYHVGTVRNTQLYIYVVLYIIDGHRSREPCHDTLVLDSPGVPTMALVGRKVRRCLFHLN
jgi:hypothetical protein